MDEDKLVVCRCEDVTLAEILAAIREGARDVNSIKRLTRAGMGLCQGCICESLLEGILREECGGVPAAKALLTARPPLMPIGVIDIVNAKTS